MIGGVLLAVIAFAGVFFVGNILNPSPTIVLVATRDISAGTRLASLGPEDMAQASMTGPDLVLSQYLTLEAYEVLVAEGGVIAADVITGEPVRLSVVLSSANPVAQSVTSLALDDPDMAVIIVNARGLVPDGIRNGDRIDIVVAIENIDGENSALSAVSQAILIDRERQAAYEAIVNDLTGDGVGVTEAAAEIMADEEAAVAEAEAAAETAEAEAETPDDVDCDDPDVNCETVEDIDPFEGVIFFQPPLAKTVVQGARVIRVIREVSATMGTGNEVGGVIALEVMVPRDSIEWITMAQASGLMHVALLSPLADDVIAEETAGASLQDLLDLFYEDRDVINALNETDVEP